jgi:RND family efflux transporter MFP subunit
VAVAVTVTLSLAACQSRQAPTPAPALVVAQVVHPLAARDAARSLRYPVEVGARYSNAVSFRVAGKLIERAVRLGDRVRAGQVLARLDATDARSQLASAQAALDAAEHRLQYTRSQLDRDQAQSAQDLIAVNQLEQSQDALAAAQAGREQAATQRALAQDVLQYQTLFADHDGFIASENADTGAVLAAGQAVFGLAWSNEVDADLDAAASDLAGIAVGQGASLRFPALPQRSFRARVREIAPVADPQSRTYRVKLTLLPAGEAPALGMSGEASLDPMGVPPGDSSGPRFSVPATALFHQGRQPALWVIRPGDSTLELRTVTVERYDERTVLVSAGLHEGENVVAAGVHTVYVGEHVQPTRALYDGDGAP